MSYVAVVPFDDDEDMSSDSIENATPFPGALRPIYERPIIDEDTEDNGSLLDNMSLDEDE